MAMQIDKAKIEAQELTYLEALYLRNRGKLPADYPFPEVPDEFGGENDEQPSEPLATKTTPLEKQSVPTIETKGGIVEEDEEEAYEEGWNNDQRRAELSKRGLSIDGRKDDLIGRLRRSDADELLDDDYSTVG